MKNIISKTFTLMIGAAVGATAINSYKQKKVIKEKNLVVKNEQIICLMDQWLRLNQEEKSMVSYFKRNGYHKIAIYGMGHLGERLYNELIKCGIEVSYVIDQRVEQLICDVDLFSIDDELPEVDAIIVTAIYYFEEIEEKLVEKVTCPIVSLEDVIYEI